MPQLPVLRQLRTELSSPLLRHYPPQLARNRPMRQSLSGYFYLGETYLPEAYAWDYRILTDTGIDPHTVLAQVPTDIHDLEAMSRRVAALTMLPYAEAQAYYLRDLYELIPVDPVIAMELYAWCAITDPIFEEKLYDHIVGRDKPNGHWIWDRECGLNSNFKPRRPWVAWNGTRIPVYRLLWPLVTRSALPPGNPRRAQICPVDTYPLCVNPRHFEEAIRMTPGSPPPELVLNGVREDLYRMRSKWSAGRVAEINGVEVAICDNKYCQRPLPASVMEKIRAFRAHTSNKFEGEVICQHCKKRVEDYTNLNRLRHPRRTGTPSVKTIGQELRHQRIREAMERAGHFLEDHDPDED